jgi:hypothetical protein
MITDLWESLDRAAKAILERATRTDNLEDGKDSDEVSLNEQISAFSAVVKYAETRSKSQPPPPSAKSEPSPFEKLKNGISSAPERRRGSRSKAPEGASAPDGGDSGDVAASS